MESRTLSELLRPEAVLLPLVVPDREAAISALAGTLALSGPASERERLIRAVLAREAAGSTGLGAGVAVPHARSPRLTAPLLAAGLAPVPIDFRSADGKPVSLVFLLAVPEKDPAAHLQALAALSRVAADKKLLRRLNKAASSEELYGLLAGVPLAPAVE